MTMNAGQKRLRFDRAETFPEADGTCRVEVTFTFADREIQAHASGTNDDLGQMQSAVIAAFKAIEEAVENRFTCALADIDRVSALGKDLIAVLVNVNFEGKQVQVFGSCQISGREMDAAVKAALNATNRFFELAMRS